MKTRARQSPSQLGLDFTLNPQLPSSLGVRGASQSRWGPAQGCIKKLCRTPPFQQTFLCLSPTRCKGRHFLPLQYYTGLHKTLENRFWENNTCVILEEIITAKQHSPILTRSAQLPHPSRVSCSDLFPHE